MGRPITRRKPGDLPFFVNIQTFGIKVWGRSTTPFFSEFKLIVEMKKQLLIVGIGICSLMSMPVFSQEKEKVEELDEVVVTATKFDLKEEQTGKVIYKITAKEIENNPDKTVLELLNRLPGVEINGANSNRTRPVGAYVRGGRGRQVLILIDGTPVSDPTGINQTFDFRLLPVSQVERIEVLKGAASSLYGTGAATGVINIILKKSTKKQISATFETSIGTNNTQNTNSYRPNDKNQNVSVNGTIGKLSYLAYFDITGTEGVSEAKDRDNKGFEDDSFYGRNGMLKLSYSFTDKIKVAAFANYDALDTEFDAKAYVDNNQNTWGFSQKRYGIKPSIKYTNGQAYVLASLNEIERDLTQWNSSSKQTDNSFYKGTSLNIDLVNKYALLDNTLQVITGVNYQKHKNQTNTPFAEINQGKANFYTIDPYATLVYTSEIGLNISGGGRLNHHSNYGNHFVYDGNISYTILSNEKTNLRFLTSYGTAFIAPSTYQLFSQYGSLQLDPEVSETLEVGGEFTVDKIHLSAVYFNRNVSDAIIFKSLPQEPWGVYENSLGNIKTDGVEVSSTISPIPTVTLFINYTYTNKDKEKSLDDYIPTNKLVSRVEVTTLKNTFLSLEYSKVGERSFYDEYGSFGAPKVERGVPSYDLWNFGVNHRLLDNKVVLFGAVSNILNEDFEENLGYSSLGRNVKLGIRLNF